MPTFNYIGLNEFKASMGLEDTDTTDDATMRLMIGAACEVINAYCGRRFDLTTATRYYEALWEDRLDVPDLVSVTTLKTDEDGDGTFERTWTTSDYQLFPSDASDHGRPYTYIRRAPSGDYIFPTGARLVQIVGTFGYSDVPDAVRAATLIQARRLFHRKDAIFGVTGSAEMGQMLVIPKLDPDVVMLLNGYRTGAWIV